MPRNDLSETEVNTLSRRAGNVIDDNYAWTLTRAEASKIQRLAGEVISLRETNAQISQMAQSEQEW